MRHPTFVHLTDLHLSHPDLRDRGLHADTVSSLSTALQMISRIDPRPDFLILSGDLTNHGHPQSYALLRQMMANVGMPAIYALGNHDSRPEFYREMLGRDGSESEPYCHDTVVAGVHVITLDTSVKGQVSGEIGKAQFAFLRSALERMPQAPKVVVLHHPPAFDDAWALKWESISPEETATLASVLRGRNVAGIFCGHVHLNRVVNWGGVPMVVSNGLHATVDVLLRSGMRIVEGTGFALCTLRPSGLDVTFVPMTPQGKLLGEISVERLRSFT